MLHFKSLLPVFGVLLAVFARPDLAESVGPVEVGAPSVDQDGAPKTFIVTGEHFRIVSDFEDNELNRRLSQEALDVVETVWLETAKLIEVPAELREPLIVNMYHEYERYVEVEEQLTGGAFKKNWAFSSFTPMGSHVVLQPPSTDVTLERVGLPFQTKRNLAHEAAHLVSYSTFTNYRDHPDWFAEGLACHVSRAVMEQMGLIESLVDSPHSSNQLNYLLTLIEDEKLPSVDAILGGDVSELSWRDKYALNSFFFSFLTQKGQTKTLAKTFKALGDIPGGGNLPTALSAKVRSLFGKTRYKNLDKGFAKYLKGFDPKWTETYASMWGAGLIQVAFPDKNAQVIRVHAPKSKSYTLAGTVEVIQGSQMNLRFDMGEKGFVSVALVAGEKPSVTIFDFQSGTGEWKQVAFSRLAAFPMGAAVEFEARLSPERLVLLIDGKSAVDVAVPGHDFSGPWGLSAQEGSGGIWTLSKQPKEKK